MRKTVLVIDNDSASASTISKTLEAEGYLVFTAASGEASVTMAKKVTPLLVFLNLAAPGTGLEICKSIHALPALKEVPIVLLTARESKFDPRYKELYGIVGFLKKPLKPESILSSLSSGIESQGAVSEAAEFAAGFAYEAPESQSPESAEVEEGESFAGYRHEEPSEPPSEAITEPRPFEETKPLDMEEGPSSGFDVSGRQRHGFGEEFAPESEETEEMFERPAQKTDKTDRLSESKIKKPLAAVLGLAALAVLGFLAYKLLVPSAAQGRRPAATTVAQNLPSKPLKKPAAGSIAAVAMVGEAEAVAKAPSPADKVEAPAKAPEAPAVTPAAGVIYFVQLGAFGSEKNAQDFQQELKAKGLDTQIYQGVAGGKTIYRVAAARLEKRTAAYGMASAIKSEKRLTVVVTKEGVEKPSALSKIEKPKEPTTKAAKKAKKAAPEKKTASPKIIYFVQLGAFGSEKNAQDFQQELKAKGLDTQIYQGVAGGKTIYRVAASKQKSKHAAIDAANRIRSEKKIEAVVTKDTP